MFLTIFDLILLLIIFCFIAFGFTLGLIQALGGIVGLVLGVWLAGIYYEPFTQWLQPYLLEHENLARVIAFIIIFIIINRLVGFIFYILNRIFNFISIIPFLKSVNRLAGALLGLIEGVLVVGIILYIASRYSFSDWFTGVLAGSKVAAWLISIAKILTPLLPELVRQLKSVI